METRLTEAQLAQVVAEVSRLDQRREAEIDKAQIQQILTELNLSPELLDEALIQVRRREALAVQQKRHRLIVLGVLVGLAVVVATTFLVWQNQRQMYDRISTSQARITLAQDNGNNLATVERNLNSEVFYRVTLQDAPIGQQLNLTCNWIAPTGQIFKQNRYQTKTIDKPVWDTQCRYQLGNAAPTGNWQVQILLGDRQLSKSVFVVK